MKRLALFALLFLNILALVFTRYMVIPYAQIPWDEAVFLLRALRLHELFYTGNLGGVFANIFDRWQFSYPPLQELYMALWPFQFSVTLSRTFNMLGLCVTSYILYLLSKLYSQKHASVRAILATLFLFTSPLILFFSGIAMKETMSTAFTIITIYLYIQSVKQQSLPKFFLTGLLLGCTFLVKYQLIYTIVATILLNQGIIFITAKKRGSVVLSSIVLLLPFVCMSLAWIFFPVNHIPQFVEVMKNTFNYTGGMTAPINYVLFHFRGIINMYSPSIPFACLHLFSLVWMLKYTTKSITRAPLIFIWINIIISTIHFINIQERYILPAMPFVFFLSSITLFEVAGDFFVFLKAKRLTMLWYCAAIFLSGIVLRDLFLLPLRVYQAGSISIKGPVFTQSDYKDSWFSIDRTGWPKKMPWEIHETPLDVINFVADTINVTKPFWLYGENGYFSTKLFQLVFEERIAAGQIHNVVHDKYAVAIRLLPDSFYYTSDLRRVSEYQQVQAMQYVLNPLGKLLTSRLFPEIGVEVFIYQEFF